MSITAASVSIESLTLDFLAYLELERGLSRNTLEAYRVDLFQLGEFLGVRGVGALDVSHRDLAAFLSELADGSEDRGGGHRYPLPRCSARRPACAPSIAICVARGCWSATPRPSCADPRACSASRWS